MGIGMDGQVAMGERQGAGDCCGRDCEEGVKDWN